NSTAGLQSVGSTAPNPGYRVLQQKTTTWKVFFRGVTREFNTGREENKGEGRSDGLWDEIALITNPISPSFPVGRTALLLPGLSAHGGIPQPASSGFGEGARSAQRDIALCSTGCAVMWQRIQICWALFALYSAAPPAHINRLALFPDKSAWCEAKNITQIVGHTGCQPRSIQNRACLGQCFSYSVPNTFPQSTESLVHCDSCMPAESQWEVVTLDCPGSKESPHVDKLVERIFFCSCQPCIKEGGQEGG
ncbi:hypothetical protein F7725_017070, partial [Dissostichus mawsoni]